jgi:hypothetical protein
MFYTKYFNANSASLRGFPLSELQIQNFFRLNNPASIFLNAYGGTSYGYKTGIPTFPLGGTTRFVAFGANELLINQYFLFHAGYIRTKNHVLLSLQKPSCLNMRRSLHFFRSEALLYCRFLAPDDTLIDRTVLETCP